MWFRNLQIYQLTESFDLSADDLHQALLDNTFQPCQGLDAFRIGFTSPLGKHSEQLVHASNGCFMVCLRREDRILPSIVVREAVQEKVDEIELQESRSVGRKEKSELKEEVVIDLLPRAFTKSNRMYAYIDTKNNWVVVDSTSSSKAEDLISLIRDSLGSFKLKLLQVKTAPIEMMTQWVQDEVPSSIELTDECELKDTSEKGGVIRIKGVDLGSEEIQKHITTGKIVSKLAFEWQERLACLLVDDLSIKRLKFLDVVLEEAADTNADDEMMRFDADFALMSLELSRFIPALCDYLGGLEQD